MRSPTFRAATSRVVAAFEGGTQFTQGPVGLKEGDLVELAEVTLGTNTVMATVTGLWKAHI